MKQHKSTNWKMQEALKELDRKLNYVQLAKNYVKEKCREAAIIGGICLSVTGVFGVAIAPMAIWAEVASRNKKIEAYETGLPRTDVYKQKYSDLVERVSEKTGVDEKILLGLIAGGNTTYANDLRDNGYAGLVPIRPEEAGVTAETLRNDDEQCLLSATRVFKDIASEQNNPNLEAAVGCFWYREMQEDAEKIPGNWDYVSAAMHAYERRQDYSYAGHFEKTLQQHECALSMKKHLQERFSGKELDFWMHRGTALQHEIKNPALLFHCHAAIEAHRRYKAGEEFDWIDLLPVKPSAAISCSLAYMAGVELK